MKKIIIMLILCLPLLFLSCTADQPSAPKLNVTTSQLALSKMVAIGNSLTAGFQSAGMMEDFQVNSYPYLIAKQMGKEEFQQPLIKTPGIGSTSGYTPYYLDENGDITLDPLEINPLFLLKNALLARPYDNLGVPGADLNDLLTTIDGSKGNPFFDMILRNPNLGNTTQLEQAAMLQPSMVLLWAGNNDVLGAALDGGDLDQITSQADFEARITAVVTQLRTDLPRSLIIMANIPDVSDIPYINILDSIFVDGEPKIFGTDLRPYDIPGGYLPLLTVETNVKHVTLPGLMAYQEGYGVPDSTYMVDVLGKSTVFARMIQNLMISNGLYPKGIPLTGDMTLTESESNTIITAVSGFNATILTLAQTQQIPLIDANSMLTELNMTGIEGASGRFVLVDPATTAFSLDGVHPNNAGYAIIANAFIDMINTVLDLDQDIPRIDVSTKLGQYLPAPAKITVTRAINSASRIFQQSKIN